MAKEQKYDVFISYSRKDYDEVKAFLDVLKERIPTIDVWMDLKGITAADEFDEKIISAIDASSYVIFAVSPNSNSVGDGSSKWTKKELVYAENTGKKVIPILLDGAKLNSWFLFEFGRTDCIDITNERQVDKLLRNISKWTGKELVVQKTIPVPVLGVDDQQLLSEVQKYKENADKKKRIFKLVLKATIILLILIGISFAGGYFYKVKNGIEWKYQVINDSVRPYTIEIRGFTLRYNYNPTIIHVPSSIKSNDTTYLVTSIGVYAFGGRDSVVSISIPESVTNIGMLAFGNCRSLKSLDLPDSLVSMGEYSFAGCDALSTITIPQKLIDIDPKIFKGCDKLENIYVSCDNELFSSLDGVLCDKTYTTIISVPKAKSVIRIPKSITRIEDGAFDYCSDLDTIVVEENNLVYDSRNNCNAIIQTATNTLIVGCNNTNIPNGITRVEDDAFLGSNIESIEIPQTVRSIGQDAFSYCDSLLSILIPSSVIDIDARSFNGCSSLSSIVVAEANPVYSSTNNSNAIIDKEKNTLILGCKNTSIPYGVTRIGEYAFAYCCNLESIVVPDGVSCIGDNAFASCTQLTSIDLPKSLTTIGDGVFQSCHQFNLLTYNGTYEQWKMVKKGEFWIRGVDVFWSLNCVGTDDL